MIIKPGAGRRSSGPRTINRTPSPALARTIPWLTVALASVVPGWLFIASAPIVPPLGFLAFVAWMQLRPGLLPIWAGLPLGLLDDLFSGQPMGSGVLLWSVVANVLDIVERRVPWRNFLTEWLVAVGLIAVYILASWGLVRLSGAAIPLLAIVPQIAFSTLAYPLVGWLIGVFDRMRLKPILTVS